MSLHPSPQQPELPINERRQVMAAEHPPAAYKRAAEAPRRTVCVHTRACMRVRARVFTMGERVKVGRY